MASRNRTVLAAALAATFVVACAVPAEAQILFRRHRGYIHMAPPRVIVAPQGVVTHYAPAPVPFLGFDSFFDGTGEQVTAVQYGSAAWRMGIEPRDTIVAVNGVAISYAGHGEQLVRSARYQGRLVLSIRDYHTGLLVNRSLSLGQTAVVVSNGYVIQRSPSQILRRLPH